MADGAAPVHRTDGGEFSVLNRQVRAVVRVTGAMPESKPGCDVPPHGGIGDQQDIRALFSEDGVDDFQICRIGISIQNIRLGRQHLVGSQGDEPFRQLMGAGTAEEESHQGAAFFVGEFSSDTTKLTAHEREFVSRALCQDEDVVRHDVVRSPLDDFIFTKAKRQGARRFFE